MTATPTDTSGPESVRALIVELADIEDAVRRARTVEPDADPSEPVLDPDLVDLLKRQAEIVAILRRTAHTAPGQR